MNNCFLHFRLLLLVLINLRLSLFCMSIIILYGQALCEWRATHSNAVTTAATAGLPIDGPHAIDYASRYDVARVAVTVGRLERAQR